MKYENEINLNQFKCLRQNNKDVILLDVRSPQEYSENHMPGSICIPSYDITKVVEKILPNKNTFIVAYCENGIRSKKTADVLKDLGYTNVYYLK